MGGSAYAYSPPVDSDDEDDLIQDMWGMTLASDDEESVSSEEDEDMDEIDGDLEDNPLQDDMKGTLCFI